MAVISSSIMAGLAAVGTAISSAASAVSSFLGSTLFTIGGGVVTSGGAAGTVIGGTTITVGGALSAVGMAASAAVSLGSMYSNARASAKAQKAQEQVLQELVEAETGTVGTSKTTTSLQDNSRAARTLSSLRISMLPQANTNAEVTQNVYGVDSNNVVTSTQNMTGLNIATAA